MKTVAILIALCGAAFADPQLDPSRKDEAAKLVAQGTSRFDRRDFQGALDRYREAYAIYPAPKLHYNIALALSGMARSAEAADELTRFLATAGDAPADARAQATKLLAALDRELGKIAIDATAAGATASVDGRDVGEPPIELHAAPGSHAIRIVKAGYVPWERTIQVSAGTTARANGDLVAIELARPVELRPLTPPETPMRVEPTPVPTHPAHITQRGSLLGRWWLWTAVGAVVIGGAVITYEATRSPSPPSSELGVIKF
jgi:hypothetical protein